MNFVSDFERDLFWLFEEEEADDPLDVVLSPWSGASSSESKLVKSSNNSFNSCSSLEALITSDY